ncbi:Ankrd17, partial [Symbiodinium microadriaticum]
ELLQRPQDPDAHDRNGETPLYRASMVGCTETARLLLEAGANFDLACGQHHLTALVVAAGLGHVDTVRVLLQAGADQDKRCAGICGSDEGSKLLREVGLEEDRIDAICGQDGVTALGAAASHGEVTTMRLLLESKPYHIAVHV